MSTYPDYGRKGWNIEPCCLMLADYLSDVDWEVVRIYETHALRVKGGMIPWMAGDCYPDINPMRFCPFCGKAIEIKEAL